ncbi:GapA-binding peptide SR1P [Paenibacillus senegalensis]|uniref:GapA-binding peptide SR1P n=1 Tax=Paenibacillus senegalensis TaxID=1465766 RepID=UPI000288451F|nr:GapA-binding peptide SR1P [Paenibacillus senegalensis]
MEKMNGSMPLLGSIHCQYCGELIGTLDTEKVTVYYSVCSGASCKPGNSAQQAGSGVALNQEDC